MRKIIQKFDSLIFNKLYPISKRKNEPLSIELERRIKNSNNATFGHEMILEDLCVEYSQKSTKKYSKILQDNGIIVIKNFIDNELAVNAGKEFLKFLESVNLMNRLSKEEYFETNEFIAQNGFSKLKGYAAIAGHHKPVILIRRKEKKEVDGGMLDAFGVNKGLIDKFPNLSMCYSKISSPFVKSIVLDQSIKDINQKQLNIYYNNSVENPRSWHVDSLFESYKVFLYLKDCESTENGPYCFVPKSHKKRRAIKSNLKNNLNYNKTYSHKDILLSDSVGIPILGKAGTLVISVQNGVHRGFKQSVGKERIAMVDSYYH